MFCFQEQYLVLVHAFIKKSQQTPQADVKLARARKKEVERAKQ
jgi:phage-related protein